MGSSEEESDEDTEKDDYLGSEQEEADSILDSIEFPELDRDPLLSERV
jgi:hypothetical protein